MSGPVAILCGAGALPLQAARAARASGREVFLVGLYGSASVDIEAFDHVWIKFVELGKFKRELSARGIVDLALIGAVVRPEFSELTLDGLAIRRAGDLMALFRGGDDGLLRGVATLLESEGFRIVGIADVAPELLAAVGRIAGPAPGAEAVADIAFGARLIAALSPFDVGQGAVIARLRTLALEAAEGTDAMLARVTELRASRRLKLNGRVGVFIKTPKRGQDLRLDLPAVGVTTIELAARAGLAGLALAAGQTLIAEREAFVAAAEAAGLFVVGFEP